jgi:uncharacterized ferritin-like protein (DUF455 family)
MWSPYLIGTAGKIRSLNTSEGLGDRLRLVAFAERQAFHGFKHAIDTFKDAPAGLREAWEWVALEEAKHESWLLGRLEEIGQSIEAQAVDLKLYRSLINCKSAQEFALYVSDAEERGRVGAEKFQAALAERDPVTAEIFGRIAREEIEHIALVKRFFSQP